ncbi:anti-sigma factor [Sphingomonas sp. AP4-R1]|uniref:anti-sigma factor family protein n=1 Tax=Sphingomonas sp. AP4-R1 TaxID=2735134 RepID=UPI00149380A4|nr:anti-sigma factor [Sphingomonas sp. AP4-R1]QJU58197.1 anti-sigma factor [Sphingomonas sp. AP4-R1]
MDEALQAVELEAYIDGCLDLDRRFVVETHLSRNPALAAQVMADLSTTSALRFLAERSDKPDGCQSAGATGTQLLARLRRNWTIAMRVSALATVAVAAIFLIMGSGPPDYVEYALSSHRIAILRAHMASQIESPRYDAREIASSTQIPMPRLPGDWSVTDVQVFPTDKGPALVIALRTRDGDPLSLFAVRERTEAPEKPDAIREGAQSVAYWRRGNMSYALTGNAEPEAIDATAQALAGSWS